MTNEDRILSKEEQKELALKVLTTLGCYKPYLKAYRDKGIVTMYEGFGGYYLDPNYGSQEEELIEKIKEVEETYGGTVYAVIHNFTSFGECYSMLYISKYLEDSRYSFSKDSAMAYVWNKTDDWCSEFGTIGVRSALGGLIRTA